MTFDLAALSADEAAALLQDMVELVSAKRALEDPDAPRAPMPPVIVEDPDTAAAFESLQLGRAGSNGSTSLLRVAHPVLAAEAFHGLAGDIVRTLEPHSEADPAALLVTTLATFGAMVGTGPHAIAEGAQHPARIWALIVGNTSKSRKGSSWAQGRRVPAGADRKFMSERVLAGFGSGEALVDACAPRSGQEEPHDFRLMDVESEFARVLAVSKREGSTLSTLLRQAWDGGRLQVRSRGGTAIADGATSPFSVRSRARSCSPESPSPTFTAVC